MKYWLYIVECADGTLYTGIATDVQRRVQEHNGQTCSDPGRKTVPDSARKAKGKGARYTSARRPVRLVYEAPFASRSDALKAEHRMKALTRDQKQNLIATAQNVGQSAVATAAQIANS